MVGYFYEMYGICRMTLLLQSTRHSNISMGYTFGRKWELGV